MDLALNRVRKVLVHCVPLTERAVRAEQSGWKVSLQVSHFSTSSFFTVESHPEHFPVVGWINESDNVPIFLRLCRETTAFHLQSHIVHENVTLVVIHKVLECLHSA